LHFFVALFGRPAYGFFIQRARVANGILPAMKNNIPFVTAVNGQDGVALPSLDLLDLEAVAGGAYRRQFFKKRGKGPGRSSN
jgi:hypothetical protein